MEAGAEETSKVENSITVTKKKSIHSPVSVRSVFCCLFFCLFSLAVPILWSSGHTRRSGELMKSVHENLQNHRVLQDLFYCVFTVLSSWTF